MNYFHEHRLFMLIFMAAVFVAIVVTDSIMGGIDNPATISQLTASWAHHFPASFFVFSLSLGMLLGHLFFYQTITVKG